MTSLPCRQEASRRGGRLWSATNDATSYPLNSLAGVVEPDGWEKDGEWDDLSTRDDLPVAFDWRDYNGLTPIRNQGGCGSCWAFSAIGAVESELLIEEGWNLDLSEQWLVSCTSAGSCSGGCTVPRSSSCAENSYYSHDPCGDSGAVLESDFPYVAWNKPCGCPYDHPLSH